jgi:enediyne biosynthesis protein E3
MSAITGRARRRLLRPDTAEVTFERRGFAVGSAAQHHLENLGAAFLNGLALGLNDGPIPELTDALESMEPDRRGFGYEGAATGLAIHDARSPLARRRLGDFAKGPGSRHSYLMQFGVGWSMARLPRPLWHRVQLPDPVLQWLTLDGYGFHQAYFHTDRYVRSRIVPRARPPWPDPIGYAPRAVDQGIGRGLWFVCGADVDLIRTEVEAFPVGRHADLWAGIGLAATYAGGTDTQSLTQLVESAGRHRPQLAQGSAFGAKARLRAGLVLPETVEAVRILADCPLGIAADLTDAALVGLTDDDLITAAPTGDSPAGHAAADDAPAGQARAGKPPAGDVPEGPAFELWRRRIQRELQRSWSP